MNIQSQDQESFDLQPFIALMMCLLGTLLLITMCLASINVGAGASEGWIPATSKSKTGKTPILVEWDGETATIQYPSRHLRIVLGRQTRKWWNSDGDIKNREMADFIKRIVDQRESSYVLFAVRPSGFDNFQTLAYEFRAKKIDIGYEPIEQGKAVRLKLQGKMNQ